MTEQKPLSGYQKLIITIILVSAAALPYLNSLSNDFVWDDWWLITQNYRIKNIQYVDDLFTQDFFGHLDEEIKFGYYRPLVSLSYMLDHGLWGDNPFGFHLTNLLLHILATLLVWQLFRLILLDRKFLPEYTALLFAVHPIHTESVSWISGRTDLLATTALLGGFLLFISWTRHEGWWKLALSSLLFLMGLLAKESAVILPVLCGLVLVFFPGKKSFRRIWLSILVYLPSLLIYGWLRFGIASVRPGLSTPLAVQDHILSLFSTLFLYLKMVVVPLHQTAYITNPVPESLLELNVLAGALILAALLFTALKYRKRNRQLAFLILFTLITLIPIANIIRITSPPDMGFPTAERFMYLPSLGFIALILMGLFRRVRSRLIQVSIIGILIVTGTGLTLQRNQVWKTEETLFVDALYYSPDSPLLWNNLGVYFVREKRIEEAERCFNRAILREGRTSRLLINLASIHRIQGHYDTALTLLKEAGGENRELAAIHYNLGMTYGAMGENIKAVQAYRKAIELNPLKIGAIVELAELYKSNGHFEPAAECYQRAIHKHPSSAALYSNSGVVYKQWGRLKRAEQSFRKSLALDPDVSTTHEGLGVILAKSGRYSEAEIEFKAAVALDATNLNAANALGILYAKTGRIRDAETLFRDLIRDYPTHHEAYINMGILMYEAKYLKKSVHWFRQAIRIVPGDNRVKTYLHQIGNEMNMPTVPGGISNKEGISR